jgi:hypothetical protein
MLGNARDILTPQTRRGLGAMEMVAVGVGIAILFYVVASIMPDALNTFFAVNTSTWDTNVVSLWDILPVFGILAMAIGVIGLGLKYLDKI